MLEGRYQGFWGRIVRGDSVECVMNCPADAFEVALILKTWVKSFEPDDTQSSKRFIRYGMRIAIGIGDMKTIDRELDMMDGDAIYRSGRTLDKLVGRAKYSFSISMEENALGPEYPDPATAYNNFGNVYDDNDSYGKAQEQHMKAVAISETLEQALQVIFTLVNQLLNNATPRKCETLCTRILTADSSKTAEKMGISVSGVNQTLKELGWSAIEQAIAYYRKITSNL